MTLKKQDMMLVYALAGILGIFIMARLVFVPFYAKLAAADRELVVKETRLKKGLSLVENKDPIGREYAKFDSYFSVQGASSEEAAAAFLKEIEKLSRGSGVVILDVKPQKEAEEDKSSRQYQISIKAEGGMEGLVRFLHALHSSPLLFSVEKLALLPKGDNASVLNISLTLVGVVFK